MQGGASSSQEKQSMTITVEMSIRDLELLGRRIADATEVLSDDLADQWLVELEGAGNAKFLHQLDAEQRNELRESFWDAAHVVIRDLIVHGHPVIRPPICVDA
jgi:hypothetical protein